MGRRGGTITFRCVEPGCKESCFYEWDTRREETDLYSRYNGKWRCIRHSNPEENLRPGNTARSVVLVATRKFSDSTLRSGERIDLGLYWIPEGGSSGSGFNHSAAHTAYAEDFPEGTRLVVTAYVETPEQAAIAAATEAGKS